MPHDDLLDLATAVETSSALSAELAARALHGLRAAYPAEAAAGLIPDDAVTSTDALLALVLSALPGWHFSIRGRARPAGEWACSLRKSDVLDDDEILGTGEADALSQAIFAALLRITAWR